MLIQCPRCSTGWRVADTPSTDNPIFKCGRCHHLFRRFPGAPQSGERRSVSTKRQTRAPAGDNLEFIFPDEPRSELADAQAQAAEVDPVDERAGPEFDASDEEFTENAEEECAAEDDDLTAEEEEDGSTDDGEEDDEFVDEDEDEDEDGVEDEEEEEADDADEDDDGDEDDDEEEADDDDDEADGDEDDDEEEADDDDEDEDDDEEADEDEDDDSLTATSENDDADLVYDTGDEETANDWDHELEALEVPQPAHAPRVLHVEDVMSHSHGFTTIARSLLAIVILHALLAFSIRLAPSYASVWLSRIPLAGALLAREPTLMQRVELRNVAGTFQELRNARRVFVITGEAVNRSPASVERIEVEATLYDGQGRVDTKVVSAGNRTMLRDLSEKEIALLQRLDPRRVVAPGESSTFLIVFLEPPGTVREFSSRVSNVRPTRRLARPSTKDHPDSQDSRDSVG